MIELGVYVTGHGFGHATRTAEVLRAVRLLRPGTSFAVMAAAPEALFREAVGEPLLYRRLVCDVGLGQRSALEIDENGTAARLEEFAAGYGARVAGEAEWLRSQRVRLVLGDVPPLGFDAAAAAGVPAIGLANFSWDWIYRHFAGRHPAFAAAADAAGHAYGKAALLLALPFAGDLTAFPRRQPIPLVAREARVPRGEVRRRLALPMEQALVLLSFGGIGLELDRTAFGGDGSYRVLWSEAVAPRLAALGLAYQDLVAAMDVVVTKPGYGIVADLIAARGRIVYTERGDFPEYPILVREMEPLLPSVHVSNSDLAAGRIGPAVRAALQLPLLPPSDTSGAAVAAGHIVARL